MERILHLSTPLYFFIFFYVFCIVDNHVSFFAHRINQILVWLPLMFPTILFDGFVLLCSLRSKGFSCIESSTHHMLWIHSNSFQMQIPHLGSTADLSFRYLLKVKGSSATAHQTAYEFFFPYCLSLSNEKYTYFRALILPPFLQFCWKYPRTEAESLQFDLIIII